MVRSPEIGVMWGTTNGQLFRLDEAGHQAVPVAGITSVPDQKFEEALINGMRAADVTPEDQPTVVMAGMVGSSIGWQEVAYKSCPIPIGHLAERVPVSGSLDNVSIISGLRCQNPLGEPDLMRGEETEILGWSALAPNANNGKWILCIPGTHCKWVLVEDGEIKSFLTSMAGEIFSTLRRHTVLSSSTRTDPGEMTCPAFFAGVTEAGQDGVSILHQLFSVRARDVVNGGGSDATARLSGLLIGDDCAGAIRQYGTVKNSIVVIGAVGVADRYKAALNWLGHEAEVVQSSVAACAGFGKILEHEAL